MKTPLLIDVPKAGRSNAQLLTEFKARHNILTHRSTAFPDAPWSALLRKDGDTRDMFEIVAAECRILSEVGRLVEGRGELSAIRTLCELNGIDCPL